MLLLMLMLKRTPHEKPRNGLKEEDGFMQDHGGWGPQWTFLCFQAVSDLLNRVHDAFEKRER